MTKIVAVFGRICTIQINVKPYLASQQSGIESMATNYYSNWIKMLALCHLHEYLLTLLDNVMW